VSEVTTVRDGHVVVVEFSNGPANYFTAELLGEVADQMERAHRDGARCVVLTSPGRHFCAGADFSEIGPSVEERGRAADAVYAAGLRILAQPLPVVAAVQGAAIGGGLGLACAADVRIVTGTTRLEANFTRLGFHPGFALSVVLPCLVGHHTALRMLMESRRVSGAEAVETGLADVLVDETGLREAALEWAHEVSARAPLAVQAVRSTLRRDLVTEAAAVLEWEAAEQRRLWATEDATVGMAAARRRETPVFGGR
jgi:enoyl-CoA hydratase/carnithine racemase